MDDRFVQYTIQFLTRLYPHIAFDKLFPIIHEQYLHIYSTQHVPIQCEYIFKQGQRKNTRCSARILMDGHLCARHRNNKTQSRQSRQEIVFDLQVETEDSYDDDEMSSDSSVDNSTDEPEVEAEAEASDTASISTDIVDDDIADESEMD